jgi:16S rRNA (uracil1498-N3)-methyltransferase
MFAMLPRFFVPDLPIDDPRGEIPLPPDEARHLTRVLRLGAGDAIAVFDGRGREFRARVAAAARQAVSVRLEEPIQPAPEPSVRLTLAQAVLKPDAMDDVVRDATMLGAARIDPIVSAHVAVSDRALSGGRAVERWRRVAVASAKQCRRAVVPDVGDPRPLDVWLAAESHELGLILVEPAASDGNEVSLRSLAGRRAASAAMLVGPEGGWSAAERDAAIAAGFLPVTLGRLTLRADAVPVVAIALTRFVLGDL